MIVVVLASIASSYFLVQYAVASPAEFALCISGERRGVLELLRRPGERKALPSPCSVCPLAESL